MKTGIELIAIERKEQIEKHGYDKRHDVLHVWDYDDWDNFVSSEQSPLVSAALAYLHVDGEWDVNESIREGDEFDDGEPDTPEFFVPRKWPFDSSKWTGQNKSKIERLIIPGALIAAEIDRLQVTK